jgi:hypothetical protein
MKIVADVHSAIITILDDRRIAAEKSAYDWKVCVQAVAVSADLVRTIPVSGAAREYHGLVLSKLQELFDSYYDADGEYTSGRSEIGTIISRIERLGSDLPN